MNESVDLNVPSVAYRCVGHEPSPASQQVLGYSLDTCVVLYTP